MTDPADLRLRYIWREKDKEAEELEKQDDEAWRDEWVDNTDPYDF